MKKHKFDKEICGLKWIFVWFGNANKINQKNILYEKLKIVVVEWQKNAIKKLNKEASIKHLWKDTA